MAWRSYEAMVPRERRETKPTLNGRAYHYGYPYSESKAISRYIKEI